jgi:hypothetical protein
LPPFLAPTTWDTESFFRSQRGHFCAWLLLLKATITTQNHLLGTNLNHNPDLFLSSRALSFPPRILKCNRLQLNLAIHITGSEKQLRLKHLSCCHYASIMESENFNVTCNATCH